MENYEIVMEELRTLRNLDEKIYTDKGVWNKDQPQIRVEGKEFNIANGSLEDLVHTIRAMKSANLEGSIENIEKGTKVFSMLESMIAYKNYKRAEDMAGANIFYEDNYNLGYFNVLEIAKYLLEHIEKIGVNTYTDDDGCSYNSITLAKV